MIGLVTERHMSRQAEPFVDRELVKLTGPDPIIDPPTDASR
jgi:hypothetical protein